VTQFFVDYGINKLFVCLLNLPPYFLILSSLLIYFLSHLSTPSRVNPFCFQAGGHRRWPTCTVWDRARY